MFHVRDTLGTLFFPFYLRSGVRWGIAIRNAWKGRENIISFFEKFSSSTRTGVWKTNGSGPKNTNRGTHRHRRHRNEASDKQGTEERQHRRTRRGDEEYVGHRQTGWEINGKGAGKCWKMKISAINFWWICDYDGAMGDSRRLSNDSLRLLVGAVVWTAVRLASLFSGVLIRLYERSREIEM